MAERNDLSDFDKGEITMSRRQRQGIFEIEQLVRFERKPSDQLRAKQIVYCDTEYKYLYMGWF